MAQEHSPAADDVGKAGLEDKQLVESSSCSERGFPVFTAFAKNRIAARESGSLTIRKREAHDLTAVMQDTRMIRTTIRTSR